MKLKILKKNPENQYSCRGLIRRAEGALEGSVGLQNLDLPPEPLRLDRAPRQEVVEGVRRRAPVGGSESTNRQGSWSCVLPSGGRESGRRTHQPHPGSSVGDSPASSDLVLINPRIWSEPKRYEKQIKQRSKVQFSVLKTAPYFENNEILESWGGTVKQSNNPSHRRHFDDPPSPLESGSRRVLKGARALP